MTSTKKVRFPGSGGRSLAGVLEGPRGGEQGSVIFTHCFTCAKEYKILAWLSRRMAEKGFCCLRFDFSGLGDSEGDFGETTLSTDVEDLVRAAHYLEEAVEAPRALIGHSMGGSAAILAAGRLPSVRSVVALGGSLRPGRRIESLLSSKARAALEEGERATISIAGKSYPLTSELLEDLERHSLEKVLGDWDRALLVVHGTEDEIVPITEGEQLFHAARQPKAFFAAPGNNHLFVGRRDQSEAIARAIMNWMRINDERND